MAVPKELVDKINLYEQQGHSPELIAESIAFSENYPGVAGKVRAYLKQGQDPKLIIESIKGAKTEQKKFGFAEYGAGIVSRVKRDLGEMEEATRTIYRPESMIKYLGATQDIVLSPVYQAVTHAVKGLGEGGVIHPETAEAIAPYAEAGVGIGLGLVKTAPTILNKALAILGVGTVHQAPSAIAKALAPKFTTSVDTQLAKAYAIWKNADRAHAMNIIQHFGAAKMERWNSLPESTALHFLSFTEKQLKRYGGKIATSSFVKEFGPELGKEFADVARELHVRGDQAYNIASKYGKLEYVVGYLPHIWQKPVDAEHFYSGYIAKFGKQAFQKKRIHELIEDGLRAGLKLKTTNPELLMEMREQAAYQQMMAKEFMKSMDKLGMIKALTPGAVPRGWVKIDSPRLRPLAVMGREGEPFVLQRAYYMPTDAAKVVNRWLEPSLWSRQDIWGKGYRRMMAAKNVRTSMILGLNFFHGVSTTYSDIASSLTLATEQFRRHEFAKGFNSLRKSPFHPLESLRRGGDYIDAWMTGKGTPDQMEAVELIKMAGGRVQFAEQFGMENGIRMAIGDLKNERYWAGAKKIIPNIVEKVSYPVLGYYVPRLKINSFVERARDFISANKGIGEFEKLKGLQEIWKSMDNRFGQFVYDNLFWKRTVRDLAQASMLSLGWNFGTWREFGGAVKDLAGMAVGVKPVTYDRIMFSMIYPITVGATGAAMTYIMTGKGPTQFLDYFYPKTGKKDKMGNDERMAIPSMMKEFFGVAEGYRKGGIPGIAEFASHKQSPDMSLIMDVITNKNYYREEIRTPGAPMMQQAEEILQHIFDSTRPISLQTQQRARGLGPLLPWMGFNIAPRYITNTRAQMEISDLYEMRFPPGAKSHKKVAVQKELRDVRELIESGKDTEARERYAKLREEGKVSQGFWDFKKRSGTTSDVFMFQRLDADDQMQVFRRMPAEEKKKYFKYLKKQSKRIALEEEPAEEEETSAKDLLHGHHTIHAGEEILPDIMKIIKRRGR